MSTIFNRIRCSLEDDLSVDAVVLPEEPSNDVVIQTSVVDAINENTKEINSLIVDSSKVAAARQQLTHYAEELKSRVESGVSQESFSFIGYGLHTTLKSVGMSLSDVGLESFSVAQPVADAYDARSDEEKTLAFIKDAENNAVPGFSTEADDDTAGAPNSDDDINNLGEGDAGTDTGEETPPEEGDVPPEGEGEPPAEETPPAEEGTGEEQPSNEPHADIPPPADPAEEGSEQSPTINMLMKDGEVQISIESCQNFITRLETTLEGFVHEIFRGIYENIKKLISGYESVGRSAEKLQPKLVEAIKTFKERTEGDEFGFTFAHGDRLVYKGKVTTDSILDGQDVLKETFKRLMSDLPKITDTLTNKTKKIIGELKGDDKTTDSQRTAAAKRIYAEYKQELGKLYPSELPGGYELEYDDWSFGWQRLKKYRADDSFTPINGTKADNLPKMLGGVIEMAKIFHSRKSVLQGIEKQQEENAAWVKTQKESGLLTDDLLIIVRDIEREHHRAVAEFFELVFKHCMSTVAFVEDAITNLISPDED